MEIEELLQQLESDDDDVALGAIAEIASRDREARTAKWLRPWRALPARLVLPDDLASRAIARFAGTAYDPYARGDFSRAKAYARELASILGVAIRSGGGEYKTPRGGRSWSAPEEYARSQEIRERVYSSATYVDTDEIVDAISSGEDCVRAGNIVALLFRDSAVLRNSEVKGAVIRCADEDGLAGAAARAMIRFFD